MPDLHANLEFFALFSYPALAIPAAYRHGCRRRWFVQVQVVGAFCAVLFWAPLAAYSQDHGLLAGAATYILATTAAIALAMALNPDPEGGDDEDEEPVDEEPPGDPEGVDWDAFERCFWDEVARSRRVDPAPV